MTPRQRLELLRAIESGDRRAQLRILREAEGGGTDGGAAAMQAYEGTQGSGGTAPQGATYSPPQSAEQPGMGGDLPPETLWQGAKRGVGELADFMAGRAVGVLSDAHLGTDIGTTPATDVLAPHIDETTPSLQGRIGAAVGSSAIPMVGMEVAAARTAPHLAGPLIRMMQRAPWKTRGAEAVSAVGSGTLGHLGAESGIPAGEAIGSIVGGMGPAGVTAAARGLARGGPRGAAEMSENMRAFEGMDVDPMLGQVSPSWVARGADKLASNVGGGVAVREILVRRQNEQAGVALDRLARSLSPRDFDPTSAGARVTRALEGSIDEFQDNANRLYGNVAALVPDELPVRLDNFRETLAAIRGRAADTAELRKAFRSDKLERIEKAAEGTAEAVSYAGARELRSTIGDAVKDALKDDLPNAQVKRLYGAIADDLTAALGSNPEALRMQQLADRFYRSGMEQIEGAIQPVLGAKGTRTPDQVIRSMQGMLQSPGQLARVRRQMGPEAWRNFSGLVLKQLGDANPSGALTVDDFSLETFFSRWDKLPKRSRAMLTRGSGHAEEIDRLVRVAERARNEQRFIYNPSGTAKLGGFLLPAFGLSDGGAVTGVLAPAAAAALISSPPALRWMTRATTVPVTQMPRYAALLTRAVEEEGPEVKAAARQLLDAMGMVYQGLARQSARPR